MIYAVALLLLVAARAVDAQPLLPPIPPLPPLRISTVEEIATDLQLLSCRNDSRYDAVSRLFSKIGATADEVPDFSQRRVRNLVVRKAGASSETIVVGAHYDKTPEGCGAVDNWTGIVALAHLYATLKDAAPEKTLLFVAFGDEEKGLIGSHAMARSIPKVERRQYCAMINLDSLGLSTPQVLDNVSNARLRKLAGELAESLDIPFAHARVTAADADSTSFLRKGIPALTLHGLSADGLSILHTEEDQLSRVNAASVHLGYRLALALLSRLDTMSCAAFR